MKYPQLHHADHMPKDNMAEIDNGWFLARPLGYCSIWKRLKLAYNVFTGKYDALKWHKQ